jgi:hypothetical protein
LFAAVTVGLPGIVAAVIGFASAGDGVTGGVAVALGGLTMGVAEGTVAL